MINVSSALPEAILFASGEKTADVTEPLWPLSSWTNALVSRSHIFSVPKKLPDRIRRPSGETETELAWSQDDPGIRQLSTSNVLMRLPVEIFQSLSVWSQLPESA